MTLRALLFCCVALLIWGCGSLFPSYQSTSDSGTPSPVVARIGDSTITQAQLKDAYAESSHLQESSAPDSLVVDREFLDQFVNYRLKVQAARDAGYDTLKSVRQDIRSYRNQRAQPRLMESAVYEPLIRTLYERQKTEVDASHILIRVPPTAPPSDTLEAYRTIHSIADSIDNGVPFGDLAYRHSDDPSAQQEGERGYRGRFGYIQAGQVIEPFERRMYQLSPDSTSDVFRTQYGYHLLKVHDRRPARRPVRLSHLLVQPSGDTAATRRHLDSLRTEIVHHGASFDSLARAHSEDPRTAPEGGDLGQTVPPRSLPSSFQKVLPRLDSSRAVSRPVRTRYGYHLLKLEHRKERPSYEEAYDDLKEQVTDRPRVERRKTEFARQVQAEEGVHVDTTRLLQLTSSSLTASARPLLSLPDSSVAGTTTVATLGDSTYTVRQLARHTKQQDESAQRSLQDALQDFLDTAAFRYAQARLASRDPSFAETMREYREGVLLFQFMQDSVWTAAAQDTAALREKYQEQREKYRYPERVRTLVLRASSDSLLAPFASNSGSLSTIADSASADDRVTVDTVMVTDQSPDPYPRILSAADGEAIGPTTNEQQSLLLIRDSALPPRQKTFEEAQNEVLREYQDEHEDLVLDRLRRRYNVETYPERLRPERSASRPSHASSST